MALAWVSVYYRFNFLPHTTFRILEIEENESIENIAWYIENLFKESEYDNSNNSFLTLQNLILKSTSIEKKSFTPLYPTHPQKEETDTVKKINPNFDTVKKRVLVTGGAGFIGSHLTQALLNGGYQVIGIDNFSCSTGKNLISFITHENYMFVKHDISMPMQITGPIDYVVHLASIPSPYDYYQYPLNTLHSGLLGTKHLLDLALAKNSQFLFSSTSEVYGDPEVNPQPESYVGNVNPIGDRSQYDQSKRGAETLINLYFNRYSLDARIARIFNTYGPGMRLNDGRVITNFISAVLKNQPMIIYGTGNQTRSLLFINDMTQALLKMIQSNEISNFKNLQERIFNIGNTEELSIIQIAKIMNKIIKKKLNRLNTIKHIPQFDLTDPKQRQPDISYIGKILLFKPTIPFEKGLEKTFTHYLSNPNNP